MVINLNPIFYALLGGILPALVWLVFWENEDRKRPEPRRLIIRTFIAGGIAVALVIPLQKMVVARFPELGFITFLLWASIEECFKFLAAYFGGLSTIADDEPIDPMIYMITAALGFAAFENALFILNPLLQSDAVGGLVTGSLRFIGSTLLHTVASGATGIALALSFYKKPKIRFFSMLIGLAISIIIHTTFNLFILHQSSIGTFYTFASVWLGIAILLLFFEKVKAMRSKASSAAR